MHPHEKTDDQLCQIVMNKSAVAHTYAQEMAYAQKMDKMTTVLTNLRGALAACQELEHRKHAKI